MCQYAGMPPVKQDAEGTDRECHLYPDRFFVSILHDCFVLSKENSFITLRDPPHSEKEICPERLLGSRQFFVRVQLQLWSPQKFHDILLVIGQQRSITIPAAEQLDSYPGQLRGTVHGHSGAGRQQCSGLEFNLAGENKKSLLECSGILPFRRSHPCHHIVYFYLDRTANLFWYSY